MVIESERYRFEWENIYTIESVSDLDLAYIAGIIDGEGCISTKNGNGGRYGFVTVGMTDFLLIEWLHSVTDLGHIYYVHKRPNNRKPLAYWTVCSQEAVLLLLHLKKYLRVKSKQAELVLELSYLKTCTIKGNRKYKPFTQELICEELSRLNKRGL